MNLWCLTILLLHLLLYSVQLRIYIYMYTAFENLHGFSLWNILIRLWSRIAITSTSLSNLWVENSNEKFTQAKFNSATVPQFTHNNYPIYISTFAEDWWWWCLLQEKKKIEKKNPLKFQYVEIYSFSIAYSDTWRQPSR